MTAIPFSSPAPTRCAHCDTCGCAVPVVDEFEDQMGVEEQARPVHVVALDCGHDIVTPSRWSR